MKHSPFARPMLLSAAVHAALFVPWSALFEVGAPQQRTQETQARVDPPKNPPLQAVVPAPLVSATAPLDTVQEKGEGRSSPSPPPEPVQPRSLQYQKSVQSAHRADGPKALGGDRPGGDSQQEGDPRLVILWDGDHFMEVVSALHFRLAGFDSNEQVVCEAFLEGSEVCYRPVRGSFGVYSTRTRRLQRDLVVRLRLDSSCNEQGIAYWAVLIPPEADAQYADLVRQEIARRGLPPSRVRTVKARFLRTTTGSWSFSIADVVEDRS